MDELNAVISDEQVASVRAYFAGDLDEWKRLHGQLVRSGALDGYGKLIYAAFVTAVRRRFSPTYRRADIIHFVGDVRVLFSEEPDAIDPLTCENLIRRALNEAVADETDQESTSRAQLALLVALIEDEQLNDIGLDDFLILARTTADQWWPS